MSRQEDRIENAMCIWEWVQSVLECYQRQWAVDERPEFAVMIHDQSLRIGTAALRGCVNNFELLDGIQQEWEKAVDECGYDEPFDWEYVPWFMSNRVDYSGDIWTIKPGEACPPEE